MVHDDVQIIVFSDPCVYAKLHIICSRREATPFSFVPETHNPFICFFIFNDKPFMVTAKAMKKTEKKARTGEGALPSQVNGNFFIYPFILEL